MHSHPILSRALIIAAVMAGYFAVGYATSRLARFEAPPPAITTPSPAVTIAPWPLIALPALQALLTP